MVDTSLPMYNGTLFGAKVGANGATWVPLMEKLWAKINGNYEAIIEKNQYEYYYNQPTIEMVNDALLGAPTESIYISDYNYYGPYYDDAYYGA